MKMGKRKEIRLTGICITHRIKKNAYHNFTIQPEGIRLDRTWFRDLTAPMHPGLNRRAPLCPMSNHGSPVTLLKFQMAPQAYAFSILWLKEKWAQIRMSEWGQSLTFTKNVGRSFLFHSTPPT